MFNRKENIERIIYISAIHVPHHKLWHFRVRSCFIDDRTNDSATVTRVPDQCLSMWFQHRPIPEEQQQKCTQSFNLMFTNIFCHHQFHFVHSNASLFFHRSSFPLNERKSMSCGWRLWTVFSVTICFPQLNFSSQLYLQSHLLLALGFYVTNVLTIHIPTLYTDFFSGLDLFEFSFHSCDSLLNGCSVSQTPNYCATHRKSELCVCVVHFFLLIECASKHCYQLRPHFMNGFFSFVVFHDRNFYVSAILCMQ